MKKLLEHLRSKRSREAPKVEPAPEPVKMIAPPVQPAFIPPATPRSVRPAWHMPSPQRSSPQVAPPTQAPKAGPAEMITLTLGDFLDRIPEDLLEPNKHDPSLPMPFDISTLSERMGPGNTTILLGDLFRRNPDVFRADRVIPIERPIVFPWKKVLRLVEQVRNGEAVAGLSPQNLEVLAQKLKARKNSRPAGGFPLWGISTSENVAENVESSPVKAPFQPVLLPPPVMPEDTDGFQSAMADLKGKLAVLQKSHDEIVLLDQAVKAERDEASHRAAELGREHEAALGQIAAIGAERDAALELAKKLTAERDAALVEKDRFAADSQAAFALATEMTAERDAATGRLAQITSERDAAVASAAKLTADAETAPARPALETSVPDEVTRQLTAERDAATARVAELSAERDAALRKVAELQAAAATAQPQPAPAEANADQARIVAQLTAELETCRLTIQELSRERDARRPAQEEKDAQGPATTALVPSASTPAVPTTPPGDAYSTIFPKPAWHPTPRLAAAVTLAVLVLGISAQQPLWRGRNMEPTPPARSTGAAPAAASATSPAPPAPSAPAPPTPSTLAPPAPSAPAASVPATPAPPVPSTPAVPEVFPEPAGPPAPADQAPAEVPVPATPPSSAEETPASPDATPSTEPVTPSEPTS